LQPTPAVAQDGQVISLYAGMQDTTTDEETRLRTGVQLAMTHRLVVVLPMVLFLYRRSIEERAMAGRKKRGLQRLILNVL
jgi:hypothetical protein